MTAPHDSNDRNDLPALFARVMETAPADRPGLIDALGRGDDALRRELARLVAAASHPSSSDNPLSDQAIDARRESLERNSSRHTGIRPGSVVAGYEIDRLLGEGGMGSVYLATQKRPSRRVALKVLRHGLPSERAVRRFELESEMLGRLRHPGIAQVFEAGIHEGTPFFAMEYVDGEPINEFVARRGLRAEPILRLVKRVAAAVEHAHQQGVIHRDLKPANILVTAAGDGEPGEPKILDFGVAKLTESDMQLTTMQTDVGQLIGTLAYMSPEQASGDPSAVDTRSDVYSLGVLAFELLTGKLPHDLSNRLVHEAVRIIREDEPSRVSASHPVLRGDIDTIIATALEKDPGRRYSSPAAFASDITRFLENQPIEARPAGTWYQLRKFSRRNRALVGGVAASFGLLAAGLVGTTTFAVRANSAREDATRAEQRASEALQAEQTRAEQLESVAKFREDQLSELDAMTIGIGIRRGLVGQIGASDALLGIDFTGLAMQTLEESLFAPSRRAIDDRFDAQPTIRARLLQSLARSAERVGLLELSEQTQRKAVEIYRSTLGDDDPRTISASSNLGLVLTSLGRFEEADAVLAETLDRSRAALGNAHEETLATLDNYGILLTYLGRFDEAEARHRESIEAHRAAFGEDHENTLAAINNLAGVLEGRTMHAEAEPLLRQVLESSRVLLGNGHPRTLSAINNLGVNLKRQNRLEEAEPYYIEVLEGRRRTLGNDHPHTVRSLNNIAGLYSAMKRLEDAERVYRESLDQYRQVLGDDHPDTIIAMNNLGAALRDQGKLDEAEAIGAEAVEASRRAFPPGHWLIAAFLSQHASTLKAMDRFDDAAPRAIEGWELMSSTYGPAHPRSRGAANLVAQIYRAWHELSPDAGHEETVLEWSARAGVAEPDVPPDDAGS